MPQYLLALFKIVRSFFKDMVSSILMIYDEKGLEPFRRPLVVAGPILIIIYAVVYSPFSNKLKVASKRLAGIEVASRYAAEYEEGKSRLSAYQRRLPLAKDKDEWLNYIITKTARVYGISIDGLSGQKESEVGNFVTVSREVTVTTTYEKLGKWLAEIENSSIYVRVVDLNLRRDQFSPGNVKAVFRLSTVLPKFAGRGG